MSTPIEALAERGLDTVRREGLDLAGQINSLVVSDAESFEFAGHLTLAVKGYRKRVAALTRPAIDAATKSLEAARDLFKVLDEPARLAEVALKKNLTRYEQAQRDLAAEAQRRAQEEQRRAQEEADLRAALEAEADGVAAPPPTPVFVPPATAIDLPRVAGLSFRSTWSAKVTDLMALVRAAAEGKVPLNHLEPSMTVLNARARAEKSTLAIPGVKAVEERGAAGRA